MKIRAPAKINLNLHIRGKLSDGYHLIDSLMVPINLYDVVEIRKAQGKQAVLTVRSDDPDVPNDKRNLVYQAAALVLAQNGIQEPVHIRIRKKIPIGAGLGGGSSDAAATILGLNRLFQLRMSLREMATLASRIGSDVPFFIYRRAARVGGKGDKVKPLKTVPFLWMVVLYPGFPVATGWAYQSFSVKLTKGARNTSIIGSLRDCRGLARALSNDLEAVTLPRYPKLGVLKERLLAEGALAALMSGSGSSVFGIFESDVTARRAFHRLQKEEEIRAYLVHSLS
ncbi:MAG: 4-(cytidine 5'-diphospho)-2-C-methyl-D-erythritol kinase [Candidatus Binatia bacterium]